MEQLEPAREVVPVESGMGVEEGLQQEVQVVDAPQQIAPVGHARYLPCAILDAFQGQPLDQHRVRPLLVMGECGAFRDVASVCLPGPGPARLSPAARDEDRPALPVAATQSLFLERPRFLLLVGAGPRVVLLVDLHVDGHHDIVLDPVQDLEQLRHPVGQRGLWSALLPHQAVHALEREGLDQKFAPFGHRQPVSLEYGAVHGRERPAAAVAVPSADSVTVLPHRCAWSRRRGSGPCV